MLEEPERLGPPKTRRQTAAKSSMLPLMNLGLSAQKSTTTPEFVRIYTSFAAAYTQLNAGIKRAACLRAPVLYC